METNELDYKRIMLRIKWLREDQHLSLRGFADALGVSKGVIDNLIYQRVTKVSDLYLNLICDKFKVTREWLLYGCGEPYLSNPSEKSEFSQWITEIAEDSNMSLIHLMTKINRLNDDDLQLANHIVDRLLKEDNSE